MVAVQLVGHGGLDKLRYRSDVPVPEVRAGDVLIKVGGPRASTIPTSIRESGGTRRPSTMRPAPAAPTASKASTMPMRAGRVSRWSFLASRALTAVAGS